MSTEELAGNPASFMPYLAKLAASVESAGKSAVSAFEAMLKRGQKPLECRE